MKIFKKEKYGFILLLIPLSFIIGIAITELLVFTSIIFFIFFNRDKKIFLDPKIIFLFLFSIYVFFNALFQIPFQIQGDLKISSLFYFRFVFFSLSIIYLCKVFDNFENFEKKRYFIFFIFFFKCINI